VRSYARWAVKAKPGDYVTVLSGASASVPVVGRHLEVLGGFAALGVGGRRYVSSIVAGMAQARLSPGSAEQRDAQRALTPSVLTAALEGVVGAEHLAQPWLSHREPAPLWKGSRAS
jgi:hypothetical protein